MLTYLSLRMVLESDYLGFRMLSWSSWMHYGMHAKG